MNKRKKGNRYVDHFLEFGRHRGTPFKFVSSGYLKWMIWQAETNSNTWFTDEDVEAARHVLFNRRRWARKGEA